MTPAEAIASAPAKTTTVSTPVLTWLSAEQYESKTSRLATDAPISVLPPAYRMKWSDGAVTAESNVRSPNRADPPGTGASWQVIEYDFHDLAGRNLPVRIGNGDLGYYHYAHAHNLYSFEPIHATLQTHTPTNSSGAHLEYLAVLTQIPSGQIYARVWNVVQNSTVTADNRYRTTDGKPVGTITAYCQASNNVCPNAVDDNASY